MTYQNTTRGEHLNNQSGDDRITKEIPSQKCSATNKSGQPCNRMPVLNSKLCCSHHPDTRYIATGPTSLTGKRRSEANLPNLVHWLEGMLADICADLQAGASLKKATGSGRCHYQTLRLWIKNDPAIASQILNARMLGGWHLIDRLIEDDQTSPMKMMAVKYCISQIMKEKKIG